MWNVAWTINVSKLGSWILMQRGGALLASGEGQLSHASNNATRVLTMVCGQEMELGDYL